MTASLISEPAVVPLPNNKDVIVDPGMPWPSAYRGSVYSLIDSRRHNETLLRWSYKDLQAQIHPPSGLLDRLQELGKSSGSGKGSIRITAGGELLTKIHSSDYIYVNQAPVTNGWIPVYLGKIDQPLGFTIETNPTKSPLDAGPTVWRGFPFNHGERWAVSFDSTLIWKWKNYRFESAFDHTDLINRYKQYRPQAGRLYVNEHGHVFGNVPRNGLPNDRVEEIAKLYTDWQHSMEREGDTAALRLVARRLKVTGDGDPREGHLPLYLGHLSQFDDGVLPRPVVNEDSYYMAVSRGETLSSY